MKSEIHESKFNLGAMSYYSGCLPVASFQKNVRELSDFGVTGNHRKKIN